MKKQSRPEGLTRQERWWDRWLQQVKHWERRFYFSDYEELKLRDQWMSQMGEERVVSLPLSVPPEKAKEILVYKPDDIGDAVMALPALRVLRERYPGSHITLLCQKKTEPIFSRSNLVHRVVGVETKVRGIRFQTLDLSPFTNAKFAPFDVSVFLRTYPALYRQYLQIPARIQVHPSDPRMPSSSIYRAPISLWGEERAHQSLQLMQILSPLTGKTYRFSDIQFPEFSWKPEDEIPKTLWSGSNSPYAVLHPFNKYETKRYPTSYWADLLNRIHSEWPELLIISVGGKEDPLLPSLPFLVQLQGKLTLGQTGKLIHGSRFFLGNESGPGHWAGAMGKPVATLMSGHSYPSEWGVWGNSLSLRINIACAPCHLRTCPVYKVACLTEMTPEKIWSELKGFLEKALQAETSTLDH